MGIKILRIYIENSVIGGYFDEEFKDQTQKLFDAFRNGIYRAVISSHTIWELNNGAPDHVKENLKTIELEEHDITEEMLELTEKYMDEKVVSENYRSDALHIAVATVLGVDVLVSWNFKHIVNLDKIKLFNSVNMREGYNILEIRTPQEVIRNE
jgi:predicted nucleic acid-binding protein